MENMYALLCYTTRIILVDALDKLPLTPGRARPFRRELRPEVLVLPGILHRPRDLIAASQLGCNNQYYLLRCSCGTIEDSSFSVARSVDLRRITIPLLPLPRSLS